MVNIAILGYGTVGSGVAEVIGTNKKEIKNKAGQEIMVKHILDLRDFPGDPYEDRVTHDFNTILNDPEIRIICETMGGLKPAYDFTKEALSRGISVCTSNKELVAAHGPELIKIAREHKCNYLFEAAVGGGIPLIRVFNNCLTAERIEAVTGILNGTTNYILTKMQNEGSPFDEVLKTAQEKGYAERNPEADIEGYDAGRKIAILASLVSGKNMRYEDVYTEGIGKISATDFAYAKKMNSSIKLFAIFREVGRKYYAMVAPFIVDGAHPLSSVNGVFNAVFVHCNMLDDTMYYGRGAGKLPTASAVVGDVIDASKHIGTHIICRWTEDPMDVLDFDRIRHKFFVRCEKGKEDKALELFKGARVLSGADAIEFVFVTNEMTEKDFREKAAELGIISRIRVME
ncbi:MAG: homoserine dehydrogenase [Lachnospiraceae bacterium]|nr:homoserine dehydrogenase [Lachnospiraceae bacterium]